MLVALTIWNGRISPVCDVARQLLLLDVQKAVVVSRREETLVGGAECQQASRLRELKPDVLICGAISRPVVETLTACGVRLLPFVAGDVEKVIEAYLGGKLPNPALSMPGCCGQRRRCRGSGMRQRAIKQ